MSFKSIDLEEVYLVKPPHSCDTSCGDPCTRYTEIEAEESKTAEPGDSLAQHLARYHGMIKRVDLLYDPIVERFPLEIITTIFGLCLPKQRRALLPQDLLDGKIDNAGALFALGAVCKTWRQIIWSTPHFWSHIYIPIHPSNIENTITFVKDWIDRTGQMPLSLAVYFSQEDGFQDEDYEWLSKVKPLSAIVNATSSRWECLDLKLPPRLLNLFSGSPSNLLELRVSNIGFPPEEDDDGEVESASFIVHSASKPRPTYAMIDSVPLQSIDILWDNVTRVLLKECKMEECFELLRLAPKLMECMFGFIRADDESILVPVSHHNLKVLKLFFPKDPDITAAFFDGFTLPELEVLNIQSFNEILPAENLISLIRRSSCRLYSLEIKAVLEEQNLLSLFRAVPSLEQLTLSPSPNEEYTSRNFFKLIAETTHIIDKSEADSTSSATPTNPNFLPELQTLAYSTTSPGECESIWDIIPDLFGKDGSDYDDEGKDLTPHIRKRPLDTLTVSFDHWPWSGTPLRNPGYISKPTLDRIEKLLDMGHCDIDIMLWGGQNSEPVDFIESSIAHHFPQKQFEVQVE
ncbi:hypothetical protein CVT25_015129 [Psilocybe cyanescens]|uniref:Uncharacterized protein n=1 Tax=Psilocybe cyanescens TaxID=93625 RepID=A0A409X251_PSICY|nr:hypothetical protein CVT25_015129 [Psilocybe cyanescens]